MVVVSIANKHCSWALNAILTDRLRLITFLAGIFQEIAVWFSSSETGVDHKNLDLELSLRMADEIIIKRRFPSQWLHSHNANPIATTGTDFKQMNQAGVNCQNTLLQPWDSFWVRSRFVQRASQQSNTLSEHCLHKSTHAWAGTSVFVFCRNSHLEEQLDYVLFAIFWPHGDDGLQFFFSFFPVPF